MINFHILKNKNNIIGIKILGHANTTLNSSDLVCASISVLSQTILLGLIDYLNINCYYDIKPGNFIIKVNDYNNYTNEIKFSIQSLFNTLILGVSNINKNYNGHIKFTIVDL